MTMLRFLCFALFLPALTAAAGGTSPDSTKRLTAAAGVTTPDSMQRLTVEEAVRTAMKSNHELMAAALEVQRADARVKEAWGTALPRIDLKARYTRALKKPVFYLPDFMNPGSDEVTPIEIGSTHALDMTLSGEQILFNSAVFVGLGAAHIYARAARELYRAKEIETVTRARKAFYGVVLARDVLEMMRQNLRNAEDNHANVRLLSDQGLVSEYDLLRSSVRVDNLRPEVMQYENNLQTTLNNLKILLSIPFDSKFDVEGALTFLPVEETILQEATSAVLETNPSLAAMHDQADLNDAVISVERSGYLPTLSAFGTYQYTAQKNRLAMSWPDFINASTVGLSLSMNIFSGFQTNARVEAAQLDLRKTQENIAGMQSGLQTTAESVTLELRNTRQRIEAQSRTVEQADKGYRIATTRYKNGAGTLLEVNDAQLALTVATVNRLQALYQYLAASADLDQLLGRVPEYLRTGTDELVPPTGKSKQ
jgi:outer membrane protein